MPEKTKQPRRTRASKDHDFPGGVTLDDLVSEFREGLAGLREGQASLIRQIDTMLKELRGDIAGLSDRIGQVEVGQKELRKDLSGRMDKIDAEQAERERKLRAEQAERERKLRAEQAERERKLRAEQAEREREHQREMERLRQRELDEIVDARIRRRREHLLHRLHLDAIEFRQRPAPRPQRIKVRSACE